MGNATQRNTRGALAAKLHPRANCECVSADLTDGHTVRNTPPMGGVPLHLPRFPFLCSTHSLAARAVGSKVSWAESVWHPSVGRQFVWNDRCNHARFSQ